MFSEKWQNWQTWVGFIQRLQDAGLSCGRNNVVFFVPTKRGTSTVFLPSVRPQVICESVIIFEPCQPAHFSPLAMKLMTELVEVAVIVSVQLQTTQRQYDMEKGKRAHDRASDRLEELQATISEVTHTNTGRSADMQSFSQTKHPGQGISTVHPHWLQKRHLFFFSLEGRE